MAVTQATTLADFTSGIGTAGAVFQVDNANNRIGIGTTNPQTLLDVDGDSTFRGKVHLLDNDKLHFGGAEGDNGDLQIYHNGNHSLIYDGGAGNLSLQSTGAEVQLAKGGSFAHMVRAVVDAQVELYHSGSKKFETIGIGVSVSNGAASTATIAGPANLVIDPVVVGDNTGLVRIKGNLFVDGTTTQINSTTLEISDFVVGIASTATTDLLTDGAGIKIGPDNTFLYEHNGGTNSSLKSSENLNVASGKGYQINQTEVLNATTLGSNVVSSSLTSVGTLSSLTVSGRANIGASDLNNRAVNAINASTTVGSVSANNHNANGILFQGYNSSVDDNNASFVVESDGSTGIGTGVAGAPLHVLSTGYPTAIIQRNHAINYPRFRLINTANDGADLDGLGDGTGGFRIACVAAGVSTERFRIASNGYIGMNLDANVSGNATVTPWTNLHVVGSNVADGVAARTNSTPTGQLHVSSSGYGINKGGTISLGSEADNVNPNAAYASISGRRASATSYHYQGYLTLNVSDGTTLDEKVRITSAGSVGIGTNNPAHKLDVIGGNIRVGKTSNGQFIGENNSGTVKIKLDTDGNSHLSGGNVGIRTTIPNNNLTVGDGVQTSYAPSTAGNYIEIARTSGADAGLLINKNTGQWLVGIDNSDGANAPLRFEYGAAGSAHPGFGAGTLGMIIKHDGKIGIGTDNPQSKLEVAGTISQTVIEYPTIRPALDLNFAATKVLDDRITFTRDSIGTYTDENGLVKYASNNVPRFDHDPTTRESLGLLIEESRTNLLTYSNITSGEGIGTGYANGGTTVSKGSNATAPDGTLTAWNSVYNGTSGDASLYKAGGEITTTNSTSYTLSVFAKVPSTNTYVTGVRLRTFNSNHAGGFNLLTGTVLGTAEGTTTNRIEAYPNGWYRCSITFTSGTDGNQGVQFYLINNASTALNSAGANGEELYLWGAQLEEGAFVTSYIPTSGSTVTREADIAKITGTNFTDFHNATEGTLYGEYKSTSVTAPYIVMLSDGTDNNRTIMVANYDSYQAVVKYNNGTNQAVIDGGTPIANANNKTALAFKKDDFALSLNGGTVATDTSGDVSVNNTMTIGSRHGNDSFANTTINGIKYYNKRLPNAQLQGLTQQ